MAAFLYKLPIAVYVAVGSTILLKWSIDCIHLLQRGENLALVVFVVGRMFALAPVSLITNVKRKVAFGKLRETLCLARQIAEQEPSDPVGTDTS